MKKNCFYTAFFAVAIFAMLFSCTKENVPAVENNDFQGEAGQITICATLSDAVTKVSFTPAYDENGKPSNMALTWAEGDALRVYDHSNRSKYDDFTLKAESVGKTTGSFTGTPVNTGSATSFDVEVIGGAGYNYAVQTQPSDGVTTGLKYIATASNVADLSSITLTEFSSVLAITAKMPSSSVAANIKSVDITASQSIFNGGKTLSITLTDKGDADNDGILHFYATLPQGSTAVPEGTTLLVHFNAPGESHDVYTRFVELGSQTFTANKLNAININAEQSASHAGLATNDGTTAEKAYLVGDKYQMQAMKSLMPDNAVTYFKMVDDVDLDGVSWEPLNHKGPETEGGEGYLKKIFFDGGNHTVANLNSTGENYDYPSFAGVLKGTVKNVKFTNAVIDYYGKKAGVVAGYIGNGDVTGSCYNVTIDGATTSNVTRLAGIFASQGDNIDVLSNCEVKNASISSTDARVGGLVGSVVKANEISDCCAENVSITSDYYYVGGLIGQIDGNCKVKRCHSTGSVTSNRTNYSRTGGLIGYILSGSVSDSYSTCAVHTLGQFDGGLVGDIKEGTVTKCYATGTVSSTNHYSGGLVGVVTGSATIEKSYFNGTISLPTGSTGKAQAGGIVSYIAASSSATISNCYSAGSWAGRRWFGGIVGGVDASATSLSVNNCYTIASITGDPFGAVIGNNALASGVTCSGNIAWWASGNIVAYGNAIASGCYIGQEGTISAKATELGWDGSIWNLSVNPPVLK